MRKDELRELIGSLIESAGLSSEPLHVMLFKKKTFCLFYNGRIFGWYNSQTRIFKKEEGERYHIYEEGRERMTQVLLDAINQTKRSV